MAHSLLRPPPGVYPLLAVMGFAIGGVGYFWSHLVTHQEVVWARKSNPAPYLSVQQNQTTKLYNPTGAFESKWSRNAL